MVSARSSKGEIEGEFHMTTSKPAAQHLREVLDRGSTQPFEGSGCNEHVRRRNLAISVAGALLLLFVLVAILIV